MGKQARARVLSDSQAKAVGRVLRTSPRKLNLVAQSIRGKRAEAALAELTFSQRRISHEVKKVLQSAIANAENNHDLDVDDLVVTEASVGKNLVMKRFHPRARGRGAAIHKPFSQITIVVEEKRAEAPAPKSEPKAKSETRGGKKPAAKKPAGKSSAKSGASKRAKETA
ncbi:MAG TPA: 50S ribosomal protein L22 [Rhizomicrobium sp.]|jgi:large subunit ribosomal protein L22|nr:50S ribosomal protein L22 [Rhizomicrobium sp.]